MNLFRLGAGESGQSGKCRDMSAGSRIGGFGRRLDVADDRGSLTVFTLFVIVVMLVVGGMAVDFMRQETARARLQSTLDRAILAAADMDQTEDPETVVRDYFAKSGARDYALDVKVSDGFSARRVSATTQSTLPALFLHFIGIDHLVAPAAGAAEESIDNIEISLVLDVSGSMNETSASGKRKIDALKVAAKQFVDTIYAQTDPDHTSISIVPYTTQVNLGAELGGKFNLTTENTNSWCVDFQAADFTSPSFPTTTLMQRTARFDPMSGNGTQAASRFVCRTDAATEVMAMSGNPTALKAKIDLLEPTDYTSIELGVKWGTELLDPAARPAIAGLAGDGVVDAKFADRPLNYDAAKTKKVIVVLTDGINTNQWLLNSAYGSGLSDVWRDTSGKLYIKQLLTYWNTSSSKFTALPAGSTQLTWQQLWATTGTNWKVGQQTDMLVGTNRRSGLWKTTYALLSSGAGTLNALTGLFMPGAYTALDGPEKDVRTDAICTTAKDRGILIYSIGFEVTDASAAVMRKCATDADPFLQGRRCQHRQGLPGHRQ